MTQKTYITMQQFQITAITDEPRATSNPQHSFHTVNGIDLQTGVDHKFDVHIRNRPIIQVNGVYEIEYDQLPPDRPTWTATISKITPVNAAQGVAKVPNPASTPAPAVQSQTPAPQAPNPAPQAPSGFPKPGLDGRYREWNSNHRTAMMQATDRVRMKVDLVLAGKLYNDQGELMDGVKEGVLTNWLIEEFNNYWAFLSVSNQDVEDGFGKFGGS